MESITDCPPELLRMVVPCLGLWEYTHTNEAKRTLDALPRPTPFSECVHGNFIYYRVSEHCVERDEDGNPIFFAIKSFGAMIVNPVNVTYLRDAIRQAGYTPLEVETPPAKLVEKEEPCQHTSIRSWRRYSS